MWICVDGTEGSGKTTLTQSLCERITALPVNEFSDACFGLALREAVIDAPHFISESPLGQSLVFLGDFIELFETRIAPALVEGRTVLTDRGWLSKYAYQRVVLERSMAGSEADDLLRRILSLIPKPELSILLHAPLAVLRERLLARDGHCSDARIDFVKSASVVASEFARSAGVRFVEINTDQPHDATADEAMTAVVSVLER